MTTPIVYAPVAQSTFLDFTGYRVTTATTPEAAYGVTGHLFAPGDPGINVALILPRANDPATLLAGDWASRQAALAGLDVSGSLWSTYGADPATFAATLNFLANDLGLQVLDATNSNYVTSAESRTIWVQINTQAQFTSLFNTPLYFANPGYELWYWNGGLSLPTQVNVTGLWVDTSVMPGGSNQTPGASAALAQGPQSIGNSAPTVTSLVPQAMAALYDYPLLDKSVQTPTIGLIEPGIGSALSGDPTGLNFQASVTAYLDKIGAPGDGVVSTQGVSGQAYSADLDPVERSLDVGIAVAVNPNSDLVLFTGSGVNAPNANASVFTAIQSAAFWTATPLAAWSNSWGDAQSMAPGSPFYRAYWDLFVDVALANQTAIDALGDGGSGNQIGNGLANLEYNITQPYDLLVGGSSISTYGNAPSDATLSSLLLAAEGGDRATIWQLAAGGLDTLPTNLQASQLFVETVWNGYSVTGTRIRGPASGVGGNYLSNTTTSGGIDPTQPQPAYQTAFGLDLVAADPLHQGGRGAPDVAADAGGNAMYYTPAENMQLYDIGDYYTYGTSAAAPLWLGLIAQLDAVFADQGLPMLGYMNDLLYNAAAIAPGSFNDITMGNNTSSFFFGGSYDSGGTSVTPTGFGYEAGPGYDLVSGLGTPNGLLLARALTAIGHAQTYFGATPDLLDAAGSGWTSGTAQSLMFQAMSGNGIAVGLDVGGQAIGFDSTASASFAWTARFAQQSLQSDFDPALARLFDKEALGWVAQSSVAAGGTVAVAIDGVSAAATQATYSNPYGFADFSTAGGAVRVARPVAVAETAGAHDDQLAIVRMRQVGSDSLSVTFYRVDDFNGSIGALQPGDAGYAAAAQGRAYATTTGATAIAGPGYGQWGQVALVDVDAGDLVAQVLTDVTWGAVYWGFAQANETLGMQPVGHLWNYGLNTWGWEDTWGGGDRDFNDLVIGLDFTSAAGHGWIA